MTDYDEAIEQLEAKVKAADADISDLGLVVKDEYEETQEEIESLREKNSELEDEMDGLREEIEEVKELYAEALAEATGLESDFFMDKELGELKDLHEEKVDEDVVETPDAKSGDPTEETQEQTSEKEEEVFERLNEQFEVEGMQKYSHDFRLEDTDDLRDVIDTFEGRGGIWDAAAEPYREALDELTG